MKKLIVIIILMLTTGSISIYASTPREINREVVESFRNDFASAQNVVWQKQQQFEKATFTMNGQVMIAYYREDGKLHAVSRNILSDQLPILLLVKLKKNYSHYWISDLKEITSEEQTAWYVRVENATETLILKSDIYNQWSVYKKIKKE